MLEWIICVSLFLWPSFYDFDITWQSNGLPLNMAHSGFTVPIVVMFHSYVDQRVLHRSLTSAIPTGSTLLRQHDETQSPCACVIASGEIFVKMNLPVVGRVSTQLLYENQKKIGKNWTSMAWATWQALEIIQFLGKCLPFPGTLWCFFFHQGSLKKINEFGLEV